jgi:uncharacterized protein YjbI with pentapeptide repeats
MSQVNLEHQEISHERLEFGSGVVCFLGQNLTLRGCTLVLDMSARNLIIPQARFIDCTFIFRRELKNFRWEGAHLQGCRFKGRLYGNDFGEWPFSPGCGSITDCDFSEASLYGTRFLSCDVHTLRFPSWPCFTLFDPRQRATELAALTWPGSIGEIVIAGLAKDPPTTVAVTYSATELAKKYGGTPEDIRAALEKLDGVFY